MSSSSEAAALAQQDEIQTLLARQTALEEEMLGAGVEKYLADIKKQKDAGRESSTDYGLRLIDQVIQLSVPWINTYLNAAENEKKGGRCPTAAIYLGLLPVEVSAFLAAKITIDEISQGTALTAMALRIAGAIEDEVHLRYAKKEKRNFFEVIRKDLNARTSNMQHKRRVLILKMNKAGVAWEGWPRRDKLLLGTCLIDALIQTTPYFALAMRYERKNRTVDYIEATERFAQWSSLCKSGSLFSSTDYWPMVAPPADWTGPRVGGYHSLLRPLPLVKTWSRNYLDELENVKMPTVYDAVNAVQATAWRVHPQVLAVQKAIWDSPVQNTGLLPPREDLQQPPRPFDIDTNHDALKKWKKASTVIGNKNRQLCSQRVQYINTLALAERFVVEPEIYFPHQMDFRGRLYPIPSLLNPQGPDHTKALLTFAYGKPLGTQGAADWLAIHGANQWGEDKVAFADRIAWIKKNEQNILDSAANPLDFLFWQKADAPWQFLAFCFEWAGYKEHGLAFESSLPVSVDGSCNGLQHFSAMLRDPIGGAAVNLIPSDKPKDIYQLVADKALVKLNKLPDDPLAREWLIFGINRETTKRCVMVLPYGGTMYAFKRFIQDHLVKRFEKGEPNVFGDNYLEGQNAAYLSPAAIYLADVIQQAISETVVAAVAAMDWLQEVVQPVIDDGMPIHWTTPVGFPVSQVYFNFGQDRIMTFLHGKRVALHPRNELRTIDSRRQSNGIAPNFVHSLDAAALMMTVVTATASGVGSFAMVHDSYGTHAADMLALTICLRHAFVGMYRDDIIQKFMKEIKLIAPEGTELPAPPARGTLELGAVLKSAFFFA